MRWSSRRSDQVTQEVKQREELSMTVPLPVRQT